MVGNPLLRSRKPLIIVQERPEMQVSHQERATNAQRM